MTPLETVLDALRAHGCNPRQNGSGWSAKCPAHDDRHPSLSIGEGDTGCILVECHAGTACSFDEIRAALDLPASAFFREKQHNRKSKIFATYDYTDENGKLLFQVVRFTPKDFRQRRPDGNSGWAWKLGDVRRVLYRLPRVLDAVRDGLDIVIVEGEKDVEAVERADVVATCNPGGAGKWRDDYVDALAGARRVLVVADRDDVGREHARQVAASLQPFVDEVLVVEAAEGNDVTDHLDAGHTLEELVQVVEPEPEPDDSQRTTTARFSTGGAFILDAPAQPPVVWGNDERVLWTEGEPFLLVGPQGVGKTTVGAQITLARIGLLDGALGLPVVDTGERVLFLACDRAAQIARVFRRLVDHLHVDRKALDERLVFWSGPPPRDLAKHPDTLTEMCRDAGADVDSVWLDAVKDVAVGLTDDEVGSGLNMAMQTAVAEGIQVGGNHHQRKGRDGKKPDTLEDVYGSTWITAGCGSVVLLWGNAGDPIVSLTHLKQPAAEVGPWQVEHDHLTGLSLVFRGQIDPLRVLQNHGARGITAMQLARVMYEKESPTDNERRKAQYQLDRLRKSGLAQRDEPKEGGLTGTTAARYFPADPPETHRKSESEQ
jgi:5S rRNA maturation endonuclease (ribonuclease M5)